METTCVQCLPHALLAMKGGRIHTATSAALPGSSASLQIHYAGDNSTPCLGFCSGFRWGQYTKHQEDPVMYKGCQL